MRITWVKLKEEKNTSLLLPTWVQLCHGGRGREPDGGAAADPHHGMAQPQAVQTQSPQQHVQVQKQHQEPVQSPPPGHHNLVPDYFQDDARQDIPGIHINQGNSVNTGPYQKDVNIHQQIPEPDHSPTLRRSERATRGQTRRYDDFVQTILPVCPPSQMMTNLMMPNQVMTNQYQYPQMMSNQMMTNKMMTNQMPMQPTMLWYQ